MVIIKLSVQSILFTIFFIIFMANYLFEKCCVFFIFLFFGTFFEGRVGSEKMYVLYTHLVDNYGWPLIEFNECNVDYFAFP